MNNDIDNRKLEIIKNKLVFSNNYTSEEIELILATIMEYETSDWWDSGYYNYWKFNKSFGAYYGKRFTWCGYSIGGQSNIHEFIECIKGYYCNYIK